MQKARPRFPEGDPSEVARADIFAFNDGIDALLHVGKYLLERAENEFDWLEIYQESSASSLPGGPNRYRESVRIPNYVWLTT
ncbi:MAG: hypothetical protein Ct9H90mP25_3790 [Gammaproteobacteria bacterium]|nr:MAG: hypothetical protein Ct9H90mP25_3790 [Gammaproteobacteria bacterium]